MNTKFPIVALAIYTAPIIYLWSAAYLSWQGYEQASIITLTIGTTASFWAYSAMVWLAKETNYTVTIPTKKHSTEKAISFILALVPFGTFAPVFFFIFLGADLWVALFYAAALLPTIAHTLFQDFIAALSKANACR